MDEYIVHEELHETNDGRYDIKRMFYHISDNQYRYVVDRLYYNDKKIGRESGYSHTENVSNRVFPSRYGRFGEGLGNEFIDDCIVNGMHGIGESDYMRHHIEWEKRTNEELRLHR